MLRGDTEEGRGVKEFAAAERISVADAIRAIEFAPSS